MATALSQSLAVQAIKVVPNGRFSTFSPRFERPAGRFPHRPRRSLILRASNETSSSAPSGGEGGATSVELLEPEHEEQLAEVARLLSVATSPSGSVGNGSGGANLRLGEAAAGELVRQLDTAGRAALLTALFPGCACSFSRRCNPLVSSVDTHASVPLSFATSVRLVVLFVPACSPSPITPHPILASGLIPAPSLSHAATERHDAAQEFQAADVNHDGVLDAREFATYVEAQNAKMAAADRPLNLHQLGLLATRSAIGNIGFGVTDNTIMLIAGDIIEGTLGAAFGISTLMQGSGAGHAVADIVLTFKSTQKSALYPSQQGSGAGHAVADIVLTFKSTQKSALYPSQQGSGAGHAVADIVLTFKSTQKSALYPSQQGSGAGHAVADIAAGLGNAVSDIVGTVFREYIEGATGRFLPDVNFSSKQLADSRARWAETGGATVGGAREGGAASAAAAAGVPVPVATVAQVACEEGLTDVAAAGAADKALEEKIGDLGKTAGATGGGLRGAFTQGATAHASISAAHWMGPSPSFRPSLAGAVEERGGLGVALLLALSAFNVARRVRGVFMRREGERRDGERVGDEERQS
ncbi:unnamed protein product [Closterium sp. NIES-64]|nr:unnamed protein product [Closterium sp. NIES-64]